MNLITSPLTTKRCSELNQFLERNGLSIDPHLDFTACLVDDHDQIIASASLDHSILKDVAADTQYQGDGLIATCVSCCLEEAASRGLHHITLFTKPQWKSHFESLGFSAIFASQDVLFMENKKNGFQHWLDSIEKRKGNHGAILCNCNPMTLGHKQLIETAAKQCDTLYVFIVEEDRSYFTFKERFAMVQETLQPLKNVLVIPSGPYQISSATFPDYFLKEKQAKTTIQVHLDLSIFKDHIAPTLHITKRFVGTEPFDVTTMAYNAAMKVFFLNTDIEYIEIPRFTQHQTPISATQVRSLIQMGKLEEASLLVPEAVKPYLKNKMLG